jgi:hypothetical protein
MVGGHDDIRLVGLDLPACGRGHWLENPHEQGLVTGARARRPSAAAVMRRSDVPDTLTSTAEARWSFDWNAYILNG